MTRNDRPCILRSTRRLALILAALLVAGPALAAGPPDAPGGGKGADKSSSKGNGKGADRGDKADRGGKGNAQGNQAPRVQGNQTSGTQADRRPPPAGSVRYFDDQRRVYVREYYVEQYPGRACPPGLAKKNNGCLPPGQAKKWVKGKPLPRDVIFHDVPQELVIRLGPPPSGHRYVRIAGDILLIAIGTAMVIDAIEDLGRM